MSKACNRLAERPKPPAWNEITEDVQLSKDDDVVFTFGKENMPVLLGTPTKPCGGPGNTSNLNTSELSAPDSDTSMTDPALVQESCEKVLRLLNLYTKLKDSPASLQEQYAKLKELGENMNASIEELRTLSQMFVSSTGADKLSDQPRAEKDKTSPKQEVSSVKGKSSKHNKKK